MNDLNEEIEIFSVSELNSEARDLLEDNFSSVWVEGEISNFVAPTSGHWYFSLKDKQSQVRCALFRGNQRKIGFKPKDGDAILLRGRLSLYTPRGDYQIIADFMEERGEGKLRKAYEALKRKLAAAGLFDEAHKQPIPEFPKTIGVITSATGAAIRDILHVLKRRSPATPIIIYPSLVQGETAAASLCQAIQTANTRKECDVLILARGGGSLEDLWPFNDEKLANTIHASQIPIISGVGHEVDFTIADFVADLRAPTPSAAAELVTTSQSELLKQLESLKIQIDRKILQTLQQHQHELLWMLKHLKQQHPKRQLTQKQQQLDYFSIQLNHLMNSTIKNKQHRLTQLAGKIDIISPLATLKRGYAIASDQDGHIIKSAKQVKSGDSINIHLHQGKLACTVNEGSTN